MESALRAQDSITHAGDCDGYTQEVSLLDYETAELVQDIITNGFKRVDVLDFNSFGKSVNLEDLFRKLVNIYTDEDKDEREALTRELLEEELFDMIEREKDCIERNLN